MIKIKTSIFITFLCVFGILFFVNLSVFSKVYENECTCEPEIEVITVEVERQIYSDDISYLISLRSNLDEKTRINIARCIVNSATRYDIDPILLTSVIDIESQWNPNAKSPKGAKGLTQIMIDQHLKLLEIRCIDESSIYDIEVNIDVGAQILAYCHQQFEDIKLILAAYNAGVGAVNKYNDIPPYTETLNYVKNVLEMYGYMSIVIKES